MSTRPTTRKLSDKHETFLAALLDGRRSRGSGNQWNDPMDGRNDGDVPYAFAWEGKSTQGRSIGVSRQMWDKAVEQSRGLAPLLALRFYGTSYALNPEADLVVLDAHDFQALLQDARAYRAAVR
jgi:hypothetical protein